jgi:parvulin-like peptidyl-prolyl isomerase
VNGRALALLPVAALALACRREPSPAPDVVAEIAGEPVPYASFEDYVASTVGDPDAVLGSDVLSGLFDQFLDERLLARLAAERGLVRGGLAAGERGARQVRLALDALLAADLAAEPGPAEVERWYAAHRAEWTRPERVRLRQILVEDRAAAERAVAEVAAGAGFGEVARRLSRDPSAARGGDQGVLARSDLPPAFADTIFALRPGEVSRIIQADYGFHVFQVVERLPAEVVPLPRVAGEIRDRLRRERADRRMAALVEECRTRYDVLVHARNLPFDYEGFYREPPARNQSRDRSTDQPAGPGSA